MTEGMHEYSLPEHSRARVWLGSLPKAKSHRVRTLEVVLPESTRTANNKMAIEVWQGQGARAVYGMLGGTWIAEEGAGTRLQVDVGEVLGAVWPDGLSNAHNDPAYLGLPSEYAPTVLRALQGAPANLGPGILHVTHAAHSKVGSSPAFFSRLAGALASLCAIRKHGRNVSALLEGALRGPARPTPIEALHRAAARGASVKELFDVLHEACGAEPYQRGLVVSWFFRTFEIGVREIQNLLSWEGFGDGASEPIEVIESMFARAPLKLR